MTKSGKDWGGIVTFTSDGREKDFAWEPDNIITRIPDKDLPEMRIPVLKMHLRTQL